MSVYQTPLVAVINESSLTDDEVLGWVPGFQEYISYHLRRAWGVTGHVVFYPKGATLGKSYSYVLPVYIQDDSDVQGALGYHTIDDQSNPSAYVFQATCEKYKVSTTVCATHEIAESLCDIKCSFSGGPDAADRLYALEVGDPVENDNDGFTVHGVLCSDFIWPAWFVDGGVGKFDEMDKCTKPFEVLEGGYVSIWTGTGWQQKQMQAGTLTDVESDDPDDARVQGRR
jgi:hypothetical protein